MGCRADAGDVVLDDPGDDVTSHAEDGMLLAYNRLLANRDALLAENQRLEHERNFLQRELGFKNTMRAENQRLREALERIEQVACEFGYTGDERDSCACPACETLVIAREALAGDAE